ncbi:glycosyltransferase family 4 protein [bacterium]|nr:glycosyltransferase family 4 protein [bacterium]
MTSLRILYDVPGWAYHNEAVALQKYAPPDFEVSIAPLEPATVAGAEAALGDGPPADIVLLLREFATAEVADALRRRRWPSKLVVGWSCGFPRRLGEFYALRHRADGWIFNNRECWLGSGQWPRTVEIANGVDLDVFSVTRPPATRRPKVLWVGSQLYRRLKGHDDLMLPLRERLRGRGIDCELLLVDSRGPHKRTPRQMAEWYNAGTVLVCASESEGTPNPALEAAACGCTVVSTRVGNMPELIRDDVNGYLVERDLESLAAGVERALAHYPRLAEAMQQDIRAWHWADRSREHFAFLRGVLASRPAAPAARPDLSRALTVFVTTVGAPTIDTCLAHLAEQDCTFPLRVLDRVAPMDAAFQRMLDECRTPYYVQVDEDMLLHPHAVRTLHDAMAASPPAVAVIARTLYDVHLERCIFGVKIFRHEVVRRYPFRAIEAFEIDQVQRFEADGYRLVKSPCGQRPLAGHTLGMHGTRWTPESIYERYANLQRRLRVHPDRMQWFAEYGPIFLRRFLDDPSDLNALALLGLMAGHLAAPTGPAKDYRTREAVLGVGHLRAWLESLRHHAAAPPRGLEPDAPVAQPATGDAPSPADGVVRDRRRA